MTLSHRRRRYAILLLPISLVIPPSICQPEPGSKFDICKDRLDRILNGTLVFNGIDAVTIHQYLYRGPVGGMRPEYARIYRETFITITTEGCKAICDDPVDWYWTSDPSLTLGIVSNWILPIIALLAALPFDNGRGKGNGNGSRCGRKRRRARDTARAVWNWLGSPQTALTATFFNIHQMRVCLDAANAPSSESLFGEKDKAVARDAYYVLSCIGQFELPETDAGLECFLHGVVYGLFRPAGLGSRSSTESPLIDGATDMVISNDTHTIQAQRWTRDLLRAMARQMRRSRRLGMYSTLASIFLFFVAYAASVVLAFAEGLGERTTTHSLAFGILITWLPLLLMFSILDRNPNSADRTRDFAHRWLWNVRAVREWEREMTRMMERDPPPRSEDLPQQPYWWTRKRERERAMGATTTSRDRDLQKGKNARVTEREQDVCCGVRVPPQEQCNHELGIFVGQGRKMGYYGLALSVVDAVRSRSKVEDLELRAWLASDEEAAVTTSGPTCGFYETSVDKTRRNINERPPLAWTLLALTALAMVWWELGMALMISYNIPTVGIGCRSGSYLVYGGLSTVPWLAHVYRYLALGPSRGSEAISARMGWLWRVGELIGMILDGLSAFCMLVAVPCLVFITFAAFSGVLKNCTCRGGLNQYMDFESATLYSNPAVFNVKVWWIVAAVTAAIPVVLSFVVAIPVLVFRLQPLWQEEQDQEQEMESELGEVEDTEGEDTPLLGADMDWVAR